MNHKIITKNLSSAQHLGGKGRRTRSSEASIEHSRACEVGPEGFSSTLYVNFISALCDGLNRTAPTFECIVQSLGSCLGRNRRSGLVGRDRSLVGFKV